MEQSCHPRLVATSGPLQGQTLPLVGRELSLGRSDTATYTIDHMSVSRLHCQFVSASATVRVRDNGSTNGTLVNGVRVEERTLEHGDSVSVGNSTFLFLIEEDEPSFPSDVTMTDLVIDSTGTIELPGDDAAYLQPAKVLRGADVRAVRAFDALVKLSTTAQASQSLPALQEQALKHLMEEIPAEAGAIALTAGQSERVVSVFGRRRDGREGIFVSRTVLAKVLQDRTALLNNDVLAAITDEHSLFDSETRSLLCVALVSGGRAYGAI